MDNIQSKQIRKPSFFGHLFLIGFVVIACLAGTARDARADYLAEDSAGLNERIGPAPETCHSGATCATRGLVLRVLFDAMNPEFAMLAEFARLNAIADLQANYWADTILEGDFDADSEIRLDRIEGIFQADELLAYRISYSARAWRLGNRGQHGQEGRISESTFVSKALKSWFRDADHLAEFH